MKICQIAAAVSGGTQLSSHPGLPLHENDLKVRIFRRCQCCRHTAGTTADDSNYHSLLLLQMIVYRNGVGSLKASPQGEGFGSVQTLCR